MTPDQVRKLRGIRKSILERLTDRKIQADLKPKHGVEVAQVFIIIIDLIVVSAETELILKHRIDAIEADVRTVEGFQAKFEGGVEAFVLQEGDIKTPWVRELMEKHTALHDVLVRMQEIGIALYEMRDKLPNDLTLGLAGILHRLTTGDWRPTLARSLAGVLNPEKPGRRPAQGSAFQREDREIASAERAVERAGGVRAADLLSVVLLSSYAKLLAYRPEHVVLARRDGWYFLLLAKHIRDRKLPESYRVLDPADAERILGIVPFPLPPHSATCGDLEDACRYRDESGRLKPPPILAYIPGT